MNGEFECYGVYEFKIRRVARVTLNVRKKRRGIVFGCCAIPIDISSRGEPIRRVERLEERNLDGELRKSIFIGLKTFTDVNK